VGIERTTELFDGGQIDRIGLGTWRLGGLMSPDPAQDGRALAALNAALDLGYRHLDTAEMYAGGHTEELIGQALRGRRREELFITSKVWQSHLRYDEVLRACQGSLRRLGAGYLDLYLIHWPSRGAPLEETLRAFNELVRNGSVRYIGVSNFNLSLLRQAQELSATPIAVNQVPYNLERREYARNGVFVYCREQKIVLTAYTPLEQGRRATAELLRRLALKYDSNPYQIALHWLVRQPGLIAIPMSQNPAHLKANLEALNLEIEAEDLEALDRIGNR
jgi:diketogulonate reductase-like aldo/keto reductase